MPGLPATCGVCGVSPMSDFCPTRGGFGYERPSDGITNDWITPRWVVELLICAEPEAECGDFDLDPCESNNQPWPLAKRGYRLGRGEDGLLLPWEGRVWCNPPYGRETTKWIDKMALHNNGVMLIFARVETAAFARVWQTASAILFFPRRITFCLPDGSAASSGTAPSCLVAWGTNNAYAIGNHEGAYIEHWLWQ